MSTVIVATRQTNPEPNPPLLFSEGQLDNCTVATPVSHLSGDGVQFYTSPDTGTHVRANRFLWSTLVQSRFSFGFLALALFLTLNDKGHCLTSTSAPRERQTLSETCSVIFDLGKTIAPLTANSTCSCCIFLRLFYHDHNCKLQLKDSSVLPK